MAMGCFRFSFIGAKKSSRRRRVKVFASDELQTEVVNARMFTSDQMRVVTVDFTTALNIGKFSNLYIGRLGDEGQYVAIKGLCSRGDEGTLKLVADFKTLIRVDHPNILKLIGYCDERELLVYEDISVGFLDHHLHGSLEARQRLDWKIRIKIAAGVARGLEYLHSKLKPHTILCDINSANILLDKGYNAKLCDFGMPTSIPVEWARIWGTKPGYIAPAVDCAEFETTVADVYCFGVTLLEIFTGRKAVDPSKVGDERWLVEWAQNLYNLGKDESYSKMVDPILTGQYHERGLKDVLSLALMCVKRESEQRPLVPDIVTALDYLERQTYEPQVQSSRVSQYCEAMSSSILYSHQAHKERYQ